MAASVILQPNISFWGDSQVSNLSTTKQSVVDLLRAKLRRNVFQGGVGGETAQQTQARVAAAPNQLKDTVLILTGHNNFANPPTFNQDRLDIEAAIVAITSSITHGRYIVCSMICGTSVVRGGSNAALWEMRNQVSIDGAEVFGEHFLDLNTPMSRYDETDSAAITGKRVASVLLADASHLNALGVQVMTGLIYGKMLSLGY